MNADGKARVAPVANLEGWCNFDARSPECDTDHARIQAELETEIHPAHPFYRRRLEVVAHALGCDDVLCTHVDEPGRYSVLHLTWGGRPEIGSCPTIDFDGDRQAGAKYFDCS
ncbi:hypothetical protein [Burkholderia metallica]|uniref:hypothetical protein n=1 Tax=Burkholderia metallica TaxID=488729 RepID=UPI001CF58F35|nr:hypothetical protein [Burkholderia metallica]MCA8022463.1 hypothetical protein [Burkholderia metallica]